MVEKGKGEEKKEKKKRAKMTSEYHNQ